MNPTPSAPIASSDRDEFGRLRYCLRCSHSPDWHRLDDSLNLDPTDPATPFRCLGPDFLGCFYKTGKNCPDFVDGGKPALAGYSHRAL